MPLKFKKLLVLAAFAALPVIAQETKPATPPDKQNLSYALGMNLALETKDMGIDLDPNLVAEAIKDVLQDKSTKIQESQIRLILGKAEAMARAKKTSKNIVEGQAFLAKNASAPGVTVLPDGLQYRVLQTGTGDFPNFKESVTLKFHGRWIDGREFQHNDALEIPFWACPKGLQQALLKMKVGSRWEIFEPYTLAYGHLGDEAIGYGLPLIYDLELVNAESETARPNQHHGAGRVGHTIDEDLLPPKFKSSGRNPRPL